MKKLLLILGMITCMLGLSACSQKEEAASFMTEKAAEEYVLEHIIKINQYVQTDTKDQVTDQVWLKAIESWEQAASDMGDYEKVVSIKYNLQEKDGVVNVRIKGSKREATVDFVYIWRKNGKSIFKYSSRYGNGVCGTYSDQPDYRMLWFHP